MMSNVEYGIHGNFITILEYRDDVNCYLGLLKEKQLLFTEMLLFVINYFFFSKFQTFSWPIQI